MLVLPIKKKWFDMIRSGEKKEEYREIKPYWASRLFKNQMSWGIGLEYLLNNKSIEQYGYYKLKNGYKKDSPSIICYCHIRRGLGKEEWGAEKRKRILCFRNTGGNRGNKWIKLKLESM